MRALAVAVCIAACGSSEPGLYIIDPGPYDAAEVESLGEHVVDLLTDGGLDLQSKLKGTRAEVFFKSFAIPCAGYGSETFGGCTSGSSNVLVEVHANYRIAGCTGFAHELMHVAGADGDHLDKVWYSTSQEASLEFKVFDMLCNDRVRAGEQLNW